MDKIISEGNTNPEIKYCAMDKSSNASKQLQSGNLCNHHDALENVMGAPIGILPGHGDQACIQGKTDYTNQEGLTRHVVIDVASMKSGNRHDERENFMETSIGMTSGYGDQACIQRKTDYTDQEGLTRHAIIDVASTSTAPNLASSTEAPMNPDGFTVEDALLYAERDLYKEALDKIAAICETGDNPLFAKIKEILEKPEKDFVPIDRNLLL